MNFPFYFPTLIRKNFQATRKESFAVAADGSFLLEKRERGKDMLRSCKYCGRIHDDKMMCPGRAKAAYRYQYRCGTDADRFRRTKAWTDRSIQIRERDHYMCLCCKAQLAGTVRQIETEGLSVHHIVPVEEDYDLRLDEENLITVCSVHHEMCEREEITRDMQRKLVQESILNTYGD